MFGNEEEEEGEYEDCIDVLKHYDLQNPITQTSAKSRLKGKTLIEGVARGILKKLKNQVEIKGKIKIEDPTTTSLGMEGFNFLIQKQKQKEKEDLVQNDLFIANNHASAYRKGENYKDRDKRGSEVAFKSKSQLQDEEENSSYSS